MRHGNLGRKLGRSKSHRKALMRNLATALFTHGRIRTTEIKAKELVSVADHLITLAKRGDLHAQRQAVTMVYDTPGDQPLVQGHRPLVQEPPGRLHPHPEAGVAPW